MAAVLPNSTTDGAPLSSSGTRIACTVGTWASTGRCALSACAISVFSETVAAGAEPFGRHQTAGLIIHADAVVMARQHGPGTIRASATEASGGRSGGNAPGMAVLACGSTAPPPRHAARHRRWR